MTEHTHQIVQYLIAAVNRHDSQAVSELFAADYSGSDVAEAMKLRGPEAARKNLEAYLSGFPDLELGAIETVSQDNRVAVRWIARGTHAGTMMNIPPTGRRISVCGSSFLTLNGGKIKLASTVWDVAGMLRAIGLLPELASEGEEVDL